HAWTRISATSDRYWTLTRLAPVRLQMVAFAALSLHCRAQHEASGNLSGRDHAPQRNEQLAGQCHDHRLARAAAPVCRSLPIPLRQGAVLLELQHAPGELDHPATHPRVAGPGQPFLAAAVAALVRCPSKPGIACNCPLIAQGARQNLAYQHIGGLNAQSPPPPPPPT